MDSWVGSRVRVRRLQLSLSIERLSMELGISRQQIEKWEAGKTRMTAGRLADIAKVLDVHPGFFFDGCPTGEMPAGAAPELAALATSGGIEILTAYNQLQPEQRKAVRTILEGLLKSNLYEMTLGGSGSGEPNEE